MRFVAIFSGTNTTDARLIAVSSDPDLVRAVASELLQEVRETADPVIQTLEDGRRKALLRIVGSKDAEQPTQYLRRVRAGGVR